MLLVYDYTIMCSVSLLKLTYEDTEKFKIFKALVENQVDPIIKCLISDKGGKFILDEVF